MQSDCVHAQAGRSGDRSGALPAPTGLFAGAIGTICRLWHLVRRRHTDVRASFRYIASSCAAAGCPDHVRVPPLHVLLLL